MKTQYRDVLFAALDADLHLDRIGGGNETEVYRTDDGQFVVKVKGENGGTLVDAYQRVGALRRAARRFAVVMGRRHSIPNYFIIAANEAGRAQALVVQPYYPDAQPLSAIDYTTLAPAARRRVGWALIHIIYRSATAYFRRGWMPDLYGRVSVDRADRQQRNGWVALPGRVWSFLVERNLLRANNLLLTSAQQIILVDYDPIPHGKLYQFIYYNIRLLLFLRDLLLIFYMMHKAG
jgi:hypothetical protein